MRQRNEAVLRTYKQRRERALILLLLLPLIGLLWFAAVPLLAAALHLQRDTLEALVIIPAVMLAFSVFASLRCPACNTLVRRFSVKFCPGCGTQLRD